MTMQSRLLFRRIIGDPRPWRAAGGNSPHENFAEAYGLCFRHAVIRYAVQHGRYGWLPTPQLHARVCRLIRRTAAGQYALQEQYRSRTTAPARYSTGQLDGRAPRA
jgi:hypothetical protein